MRHFATRKEAIAFRGISSLRIFKKLIGHKNRIKKPYVVCTYFEWMNLY